MRVFTNGLTLWLAAIVDTSACRPGSPSDVNFRFTLDSDGPSQLAQPSTPPSRLFTNRLMLGARAQIVDTSAQEMHSARRGALGGRSSDRRE
jgi:hypothetical protein